jgi:arylsulfatase A-like enzyme
VSTVGANIVLISIDTLRADHLGCYGYPRATSPNIDGLASRSFVFERAYAQSHNTLVSHATMLTSLNPISHGANPGRPIRQEITTLAEVLQSRGYRRAAFAGHPMWLAPKFGFAQGFGRFQSHFWPAEKINQPIFDWLRTIRALREEGEDRPFFLFVHYYDVHSDWDERPYETGTEYDQLFAGESVGSFRGCRESLCGSKLLLQLAERPDLLSSEELEWVGGLYDGGIAYTDHQIGELLQQLRDLDLFDSSWVVITSDHGEEFMEHGRMLHSQPYEETARVPLVVRPPGGVNPTRLVDPVGLVDLAPTLLDAVGVAVPESFEGRSLVPGLESRRLSTEAVFWTALGEAPDYRPSTKVAVREGRYTLVAKDDFAQVELYDHEQDPGQKRDLSRQRPEVSRQLREEVVRFYERQLEKSKKRVPPSQEPSREELEKLRSLGYVSR